MIFKDYYKILGLETNKVTLDTIKLAYRKQAKKYHPDVNITNKNNEEIFKDINEAYRVLSTSSSKRKYDRMWNHHVGRKNASYEELVSIRDIGDILAQNIVNFFANSKNIDLLDSLSEIGVNMNYLGEEEKTNEFFTNKKFVLTGTISFMSRDEIKKLIESYGGSETGSVSKKTDVVIVGADPGSKFDKAKELDIEIWDEAKFKEIVDSL